MNSEKDDNGSAEDVSEEFDSDDEMSSDHSFSLFPPPLFVRLMLNVMILMLRFYIIVCILFVGCIMARFIVP